MISIISYGVGNIMAFAHVYKKLGIPYQVAETPEQLSKATKLILPGVGAFDKTMQRYNHSGLRDTVQQLVHDQKMPVLGICVGMQMLASSSEEGHEPGLGWIDGVVPRFDISKIPSSTHLPHMGWNDVMPVQNAKPNLLFTDLYGQSRFYFLHSYYFKASHATDEIAHCDYGGLFACAVRHEHIYGVQFHPEKSHQNGTKLLENFALYC